LGRIAETIASARSGQQQEKGPLKITQAQIGSPSIQGLAGKSLAGNYGVKTRALIDKTDKK
jgi:hypothetical protein